MKDFRLSKDDVKEIRRVLDLPEMFEGNVNFDDDYWYINIREYE